MAQNQTKKTSGVPRISLLMKCEMKGMLNAGHKPPRRDAEEARGLV
jgi:hypothetical protein